MRKIVLTFGLISGAVMAVMMALQMAFMDQIGFDRGMIVGYTTMIVAMLLVYFGIRAYKETLPGQVIGFWQAAKVGALISLITCCCYVATWEVIYFNFMPDFGEKFAAHAIESKRAAGASAAEIEAVRKEMQGFQEAYKNPLVNVAYTFLEPLPVAVIITLVCAGIHSRGGRRELVPV